MKTDPIPIPGGYILFARHFLEMLAGAPLLDRVLWTLLYCWAGYQDRPNGLARGQLLTTVAALREATGWRQGYVRKAPSPTTIVRALARLSDRQMIVTRKTTRGLVITVRHYDLYQTPGNYERAGLDPPSARPHDAGAVYDRKEGKNEKKERGAPTPWASRSTKSFEELDAERAAQAPARAQAVFLGRGPDQAGTAKADGNDQDATCAQQGPRRGSEDESR